MGKKTALSWGWAVFIIKWVFSLGACFAGCLLLHRFSRQPPKGSTEALARLPTDELLKALDDPETRANALRCLLDRSSTERRADLETADCLRALLEAFRETKTGPVRSLALSVLARVARSAEVRAAVLANPKLLASVVQPLDDVLEAEKSADDDDDDESEPTPAKMAAEEATAELLRKAFVCLGALADGDAAMQSVCADAGAVATILDAMEWFALHRALQQWALWALFTLSFEHSQNKLAIVKAGGLERTMREMKAHPREIEIQRHAVLLLFSCEPSSSSLAPRVARDPKSAALNCGRRPARGREPRRVFDPHGGVERGHARRRLGRRRGVWRGRDDFSDGEGDPSSHRRGAVLTHASKGVPNKAIRQAAHNLTDFADFLDSLAFFGAAIGADVHESSFEEQVDSL